MMQHRT
jgi:tRNA (guanine-N7-)-methyltransferase